MGLGSEARHLGYAVDGQGGGGCQQPLGLGEAQLCEPRVEAAAVACVDVL